MKSKVFLLVTLLSVFFISTTASAQEKPAPEEEEITLTTYYPAPFGEYDKLYVSKWIELDRTGYDTGELRLAAPDSTGTKPTYWNFHNRGPATGAGSIEGGDGNKLYLTYYDGASWSGPHMVVTPSGNVGIGTMTPQNRLDVEGATAIGANYSGTSIAPANGLLVEGNVGIGTTTPANRLDVEGGLAVGTTYSGTSAAPADGAIIEGNVGIGTTSPGAKLEVAGDGNTILVPRKSTAGDPSGVNGMIYYNTSSNKFRVYENGGWKDLAGGGGGLQCTTRTAFGMHTVTAVCMGVEIITGGGCRPQIGAWVESSYFSGNNYVCSGLAAGGPNVSITAYARCCQ